MKSKTIVLMLVLTSTLILTMFNQVPTVSALDPVYPPSGPYEKYGPRVDRMIFSVSGDVVTEIGDFEAGLIDLMDWAAPAGKWTEWLASDDIAMGYFGEFAMIYLALNNMRWPLGHGDQFPEGWTSFPEGYFTDSGHTVAEWSNDPSSDLPVEGGGDQVFVDYDNCQRCNDSRWFRRGLSHMVNRDAQMAYMEGAAEPLTPSLFWPDMKGWEAPGLVEYDYDLVAAVACFENGGFEDWDSDGVMEYSPGHNGVVIEELPSLQFYTRLDDDHRTYLGQLVSLDMDLLGIPHDLLIVSYGTVNQKVWNQYDFDIYVEYWDWDPLPDLYTEMFESRKDIYPAPLGDNQHRYHNHEYDEASAHFVKGDAPSVGYWCNEMQYIIHGDAVVIPLYVYAGWNARRAEYGSFPGEEKYAGELWSGMDCYPGEGWHTAYSVWTQINAHPESFERGGSLRQGLNVNPDLLDPIDAVYFYEGAVINLIYETLTKYNPWDLSKQEPWLCSDYNVGTWEHPTEGTCSAINYTLIPGVLWQDGERLTAEDVEFSFWFTRETQSVGYINVKDYNSSVIYDNTPVAGVETIEIRFNVKSWLAPIWAGGVYIIPEHIWSDEYGGPGVDGSSAYDPEDHDEVIGSGPFRFFKDNVVGRVHRVPLEYVYLEANPLYFREYVWPDVLDASEWPNPVAGHLDGEVTGLDFYMVVQDENLMEDENEDGTWPDPPGEWGEPCDVDKDGHIGVTDLMEVGVSFGKPWPPSYYDWSPGFPPA